MRDFWQDSGYHLAARDADGQLVPSDDFLRAYLRRPEMLPPEEACDETGPHVLLANPRSASARIAWRGSRTATAETTGRSGSPSVIGWLLPLAGSRLPELLNPDPARETSRFHHSSWTNWPTSSPAAS